MSKASDFKRRFSVLQEQAEENAARALVERNEQPIPARRHRITLASMDEDEPNSTVTVNVLSAGQAKASADSIEIGAAPSGVTFRGTMKAFAAFVLGVVVVLLIWKLVPTR